MLAEERATSTDGWNNLVANSCVPFDVVTAAPAKCFPAVVGNLLREVGAPTGCWLLAKQMLNAGTELSCADLVATLLEAAN